VLIQTAPANPVIDPGSNETRLRAVLCGSYRRDREGLASAYEELRALGCDVLSPNAIDFVAEIDGFALLADELNHTPKDIELQHLDCMRQADFVWLHLADGYVGSSATLEIGFAHGLGIPVFSAAQPSDGILSSFVQVVSGPADACVSARRGQSSDPGRPLRALQAYYAVAAKRRGYEEESPQDTMLLLTEELGELARAVRQHVGLKRTGDFRENVAEEVADVQLYLVHLANVLGTDLGAAVTSKERLNDQRQKNKDLTQPA
jgi:NTP pyrophosphatase (non-canonical NTP hydrolase)